MTGSRAILDEVTLCRSDSRVGEAWTARLKVGDAVVVREKESENCYRYLLSHVIELLEGDRIVLRQHGTFCRNDQSVLLRRAFVMLEPAPALVEAARSGAMYVVD